MAARSVHRPYTGFDSLHHHVGSTHVLHHLFPAIPCFHAQEATEHLRRVLGPLYRYDDTALLNALVDVAKTCHFVEGVHGVQYYMNMRSVKP
eukprot:NODE_16793_length_977_cov_3.962353.p6 GENE.NODE_16793_length_977_cov_3.962353~~NODE_16793_length_977_cov_3.962353.p6  ORF type:complete len:92 (+),score=23.08 NODE_16793_length_977_cov_3.962353:15-290(+)